MSHISIDHRVMAGVPCITNTRIPVATVVSMVADGASAEEIVGEFPQLSADAITAALQFAADAVVQGELPTVPEVW